MKKYIEKSITYAEYIDMIDDLLANGKTTGSDQSDAMFSFGKINRQRMKRLGNTVQINDGLRKKVRTADRKMIWLIITEGWCGDAAQAIPIIEKIAVENPDIETRYVLRDQNLVLMDRYLTNNARSIPKLIALDADTLEELGTWGPRPKAAMDYFLEMRADGLEKPAMMENLQRWYLKDHGKSIEAEFETLLTEWAENEKVNAAGRK